MLFISSVIDFLALGIALWLGLYIVTRSRQRLAWLAAGTAWALVGYFLNRLMNLNFPNQDVLALVGALSVTLAAPLWYHLSTQFYPKAPARRWLLPVGYGLAAVFLALMIFTPLLFPSGGIDPPLRTSDSTAGPLYPLYALFLVFWPLLGLWNLRRAAEGTRGPVRDQFRVMQAATSIAVAGVVYLATGQALGLSLPSFVGEFALGLGIALVGYAVARYNILLAGRTTSADMPYTAAVVGLIALGYLVVTWLFYTAYNVPLGAFVIVYILVIVSHTLYDAFRSRLDRLFYGRAAARLRESLRTLAREAGAVETLQGPLRDALSAACASLGADRGFIALRSNDHYVVGASLRALALGHVLEGITLPEDAMRLDKPSADLGEMAALAPLVWAGDPLGFIAVGPRPGLYEREDLATLGDVADRIASVVYAARTAETATAELNSQLEHYRAREDDLRRQLQELRVPAAGEWDETELIRLTEDALRHLYDFAYLGEHRLARLRLVDTALAQAGVVTPTLLERGQALRDVLARTLERLRPPGPEPKRDTAAGKRAWHSYLILRESYVDDIPVRETLLRLAMSEGTYNRTRRQALRGLARALAEEEQMRT